MNRLAPAPTDERDGATPERTGDRYLLPAHAHLVVYERNDGVDEGDDGVDEGDDGVDEGDDGVDEGDDGVCERDDGDAPAPNAAPGESVPDGNATGEDVEADPAGGSPSETRGLITIYDCGAAQKPPSAQLLGVLGSVRAACETTRNPTGYVVRMREPSVLVDVGDGRYVVRAR